MNSIEIVCATRLEAEAFREQSPLGQSLRRFSPDKRVVAHITFSNRRGLPDIYNERIAASSADILVFVHDDVWITEFFLPELLQAGLQRYDVLGVAGNRRRLPGQPAWAFVDEQLTWDTAAHLSGRVAHGSKPFGSISYYGPVPATCELLDGVLLAARREVLQVKALCFDARFPFHFYDLDFCRSARAAGLRLGTWPIAITHVSGGSFRSPDWTALLAVYREKWGD